MCNALLQWQPCDPPHGSHDGEENMAYGFVVGMIVVFFVEQLLAMRS